MTTNNVIKDQYIYHQFTQTSKNSQSLSIMVYGIDIVEGRTMKETDPARVQLLAGLYDFLNEKVVEELQDDLEFNFGNATEWRKWATPYTNEFLATHFEEQALTIKERAAQRAAGKL